MNSNSVVLKVASRCHQWYYDKLKPWEHYIPVTAMLSDLKEKVDYVIDHENDVKLKNMTEESTGVIQSLRLSAEIRRLRSVMSTFFTKYDLAFLPSASQQPVLGPFVGKLVDGIEGIGRFGHSLHSKDTGKFGGADWGSWSSVDGYEDW